MQTIQIDHHFDIDEEIAADVEEVLARARRRREKRKHAGRVHHFTWDVPGCPLRRLGAPQPPRLSGRRAAERWTAQLLALALASFARI